MVQHETEAFDQAIKKNFGKAWLVGGGGHFNSSNTKIPLGISEDNNEDEVEEENYAQEDATFYFNAMYNWHENVAHGEVDIPIQQSYLWYGSDDGKGIDPRASGAYVFRPNGAPPTAVSTSVSSCPSDSRPANYYQRPSG
eukprot:Gb_14042 [translate_table: standard]